MLASAAKGAEPDAAGDDAHGRRLRGLIVIRGGPGYSNLGNTSVYLQGIDNAEIIETVHARRQPMIPVSSSVPC